MNPPIDAVPPDDPWTMPIEQIDVGNPRLYQDDVWEPYFARLRRDDPVHFVAGNEMYGSFWSVTKYKDIMQVGTTHRLFVRTGRHFPTRRLPSRYEFHRDGPPPRRDEQRKVVSPVVAPANLANMAPVIRECAGRILDGLPRNKTFDWVDLVSIELTTQMLAILMGFPFEERRKLTHWSTVATTNTSAPDAVVKSEEERFAELQNMAEAFTALWNERGNAPPRYDLISMLAHGEATRNMQTARVHGQPGSADRWRQRDHPKLDHRRPLGTEQTPR